MDPKKFSEYPAGKTIRYHGVTIEVGQIEGGRVWLRFAHERKARAKRRKGQRRQLDKLREGRVG